MPKTCLAVALLLSLLFATAPASAQPTPESVLGFDPGTDGRLADYGQVRAWFEALAKASDRVSLQTLGETTEGRPMVMAIITAPENHARLEEIRRQNLALTDPRGRPVGVATEIIGKAPVIVALNESIHSTEVGPVLAGVRTAEHLATTQDAVWKKVLNDVVLLMTPCHNPDGYDKVVHWWRATKNDPETRGAPMAELYHKYVGHDNNRDWFMLTQQETRLTIEKIYMGWRPQIVIDQHQMGSNGPRMFVPPYQEPYEPNVPPEIREGLEELGRSVVARMTASGLKGVTCARIFDAWTPARAFMHYHGGARFLTEAASARLADPIAKVPPPRGRHGEKSADNPAPWPGGRWALSDIIRYSSRAALLVMQHASENRSRWLSRFERLHRRAVEDPPPVSFIIPAGQRRLGAVRELIRILELGGVEIERAGSNWERNGETFLAGSHVIGPNQPCFPFARALLEKRAYPEIRSPDSGKLRRPYDVTCHHLPSLMNVRVVANRSTMRDKLRGPQPGYILAGSADADMLVDPFAPKAQLKLNEGQRLLDPQCELGLVKALQTLASGGSVSRIPERSQESPRALLSSAKSHDDAASDALPVPHRRIGLYASWLAGSDQRAAMDEGWLRFFFDRFELPFVMLRDRDLRRPAGLSDIDTLVIADVPLRGLLDGNTNRRMPARYRGGIGTTGQRHIRDFVKRGGLLITMNRSTAFAVETFDLPIERLPRPRAAVEDGERMPRMNLPGTALWTDVDPASPFGAAGARLPMFYFRSRAFRRKVDAGPRQPKVAFPVRYATKDLVAGGWSEHEDQIAGHGAVATAGYGRGRVFLFAFSPHFRSQTWGSFPLLLHALLWPEDSD